MRPSTPRFTRQVVLAVQVLVSLTLPGCSEERRPQVFEAIRSTLGLSSGPAASPSPAAPVPRPNQLVNPAYLVKDINPGLSLRPSNSIPGLGVRMGGIDYFVAGDRHHGLELWRTDGTSAGTWMVRDIWPGPTSSSITGLINVNEVLYFVASDGTYGSELWRSDGTLAGTRLFREFAPGPGFVPINNLVNLNGTLLFVVQNIFNRSHLWRSDGTEAGTVLVKDVWGPGPQSPSSLVNLNGTVYFAASDAAGTSGVELWKTDGTTDGTVLAVDILSGPLSSGPSSLINVGGTLFFTATDGPHGREVWRSDGTPAGTLMMRDIWPGINPTSLATGPGPLTAVNGTLYFAALDGTTGPIRQLWKSDGTQAGTVMVAPATRAVPPDPTAMISFGGKLVFTTTDGQTGIELWQTDGTETGTVLIKEICPGSCSSSPSQFGIMSGTLFFRAASSNNPPDFELWKTDGTEAGTVRVKDIFPGPGSSGPMNLYSAGSFVLFGATDGVTDVELWRSDGTEAGTVLVKDIYSTGVPSNPASLTDLNGTLIFTASDDVSGEEPWRSDGTAAGTSMLVDIEPGAGGSNINQFLNVGGKLFFDATASNTGTELWTSDGTPGGTTMVRDIWPGPDGSTPTLMVELNGTVLFRASDGVSGEELWRSDGTEAGTVLVKDIYPGDLPSFPHQMGRAGNALFITANDGVNGDELWKSDGTEAGTVLLKDINPGPASSVPANFVDVNGTLFFRADDGVTGIELWKSDGTAAGTVLVKDINPSGASNPANMLNAGGVLYFTARDPSDGGTGLWRSDGTEAGTVMLRNVMPVWPGAFPYKPWYHNGTVYFVASDGVTGFEVWKTDGTVLGTIPVADLMPGTSGSLEPMFLNPITVLPGEPFAIQASNGASGLELWKSDGTAAGTVLVHDIAPGITSSSPDDLTVSGDLVFFTAASLVHGRELWAVNKQAFASVPPLILCPVNQAAEATSSAGAVVEYPPATADAAYPTIAYDQPSGSVFPLGATTVTATASNTSGQTVSCSFLVRVGDTTAPALNLPGDQTFEATSAAGALVNYALATATDAVSTPSVTHTPPSGGNFALGNTAVAVVATDGAGNTTVGTFTVVVADTTAPAVTCPANQVFEATSAAGAAVTFTPATATDAVSTPTVDYSPAQGSTFALGDTTVTATATDAAGNAGQCTFQVTVRDTTAPALTLPGDQTFDATSAAGAQVNYAVATATDAVSTPTVTHNPVPGSQFPLGTTTVNVSAADGAGNASAGSFSVTVADLSAPTVTCPADQTFEATFSGGASASYTRATAVDAVTATPLLIHSPPSGADFPLGSTQVTATATDDAQNAASCTFNVIVVDTTAPSVTCPGNQVAEAASAAGATVSYPAAQATDPVSTPTIAYSHASGGQFILGQTAVTATATDGAGNEGSCSFNVTVRDTTAPALTCPANVTAEGTASGADVTYPNATATDAVSTPTITYGQSSGSHFPVGETPVTVTAADAAGNSSTCTFTVTVTAEEEGGGCGCQAMGGTTAYGWAVALALARLVRRRRLTR